MLVDEGTPDVIITPTHDEAAASGGPLGWIISLASFADAIPAWGHGSVAKRDRFLRQFWKSEPILASAIASTAARYAAFGFRLQGLPRMVKIYQRILQGSDNGAGWTPFMTKFVQDYLTQDNGAFILVIRAEDNPASPMVSLRNLDAGQCARTGRPEEPVVYTDKNGGRHLLKWYQVIAHAEMPSPEERMYGVQMCAVSRLLRAAQIVRDILIYHSEKIGGRFNRAIYFVSGIHERQIKQYKLDQARNADNEGRMRYLEPAIIGSQDPTARVGVDKIDLASLPDGFDYDEQMRWYMNQVALAIGIDYQDLAPLPGGNLGTSQQSNVLHMKARGKGPKLFMSNMEHTMNFCGLLPSTLHFAYGDQDIAEDTSKAELALVLAKEMEILVKCGVYSLEVARQILKDRGELKPEYLAMMGGADRTPHATVSSGDEPPVASEYDPDIKPDPDQTYLAPVAAPTTGSGVPNAPKGVSSDNPTKRLTNAPQAVQGRV